MKQGKLSALALFLFMLALTFGACEVQAQVKIMKDIVYLTPDREEKMDAYLPADSFQRPVPAMLLIHGGGWAINDKGDNREQNIGNNLAKNGIAVFSINYLLQKKNEKDENGKVTKVYPPVWPQNFYDCKSALRYLKKEAATYGIDPNKIGVIGGSAGGHLALLLGATSHVEELNKGGLYLDQDNSVRCIINLYGIHDLRQFKFGVKGVFGGATPEETEANITKASPKTYFDKATTPPILILHGTADTTVQIEMSQDLDRILTEKGISHKFVVVPDAIHSFHLEPKQMDLRPVVLEFLKENLK